MPSIEAAVSILSKSLEEPAVIAKMVTDTVNSLKSKPPGNGGVQNDRVNVQPPPQDGLGNLIDKVV
jgi:hypothetical protein